MSEMIVFTGKTYDSLEQMPPIQRKAHEVIQGIFADLDTNEVSDFIERSTVVQVESSRPQIIFHGQRYESVDGLPPEAQVRYRMAMERLGLRAVGAATPEEEGESKLDWLNASTREENPAASSTRVNYSKNIEPEGISWRNVVISMVLIGLVFLGTVTLWFYLAQ